MNITYQDKIKQWKSRNPEIRFNENQNKPDNAKFQLDK